MQLGQEWRTENSNRYFPFAEGSTIPKGFISDIKFLHNKRGPEEVYLASVTPSGESYGLLFKFSSDDSVAIAGTVAKDHGLRQVHLFGDNDESVVVFSTGDAWNDPPDGIEYVSGKIDDSLVSSGPNLIRRIVIQGETNDESTWRRETTQSIKGGTNVDIKLAEVEGVVPNQEPQDFIEISAIYGGGEGAPDYEPEDGILTINGISPSNGGFKILGLDCIQNVDRPNNEDNTIQIRSDCLPCCGCSSYQLISDAITYRSQKLSELCGVLNNILNSSVETYNAAVLALAGSERPVARIRAVRIYKDIIKLSLQNVCAIPIYGVYGVTFFGVTLVNASPANVPPSPLSAPAKYNHYVNSEIGDLPAGTFIGTVGPINPGSYVDLEFVVSGAEDDYDLRSDTFTIEAQANGYFGAKPTLGCKKDEYSVTVSPDTSIGGGTCNSSGDNTRYKVEVNEVP